MDELLERTTSMLKSNLGSPAKFDSFDEDMIMNYDTPKIEEMSSMAAGTNKDITMN